MTDTLRGAAIKTARAAGNVKGAATVAAAAGTGGTGLVLALGKNIIQRNAVSQAYRSGVSNFDNVANRTSGARGNNIETNANGNASGGNSESGTGGRNDREAMIKAAKNVDHAIGNELNKKK